MSSSPSTKNFLQNVNFAVQQCQAKSNEDAHCCKLDYKTDAIPSLCSFGVFDGHGGQYASNVCAQQLHDRIVNIFAEKIRNERKPCGSPQLNESLFLDAVRTSTLAIDKQILEESPAGTTAASLFVIPNSDGSTRVICSWVGDSKCCMFSLSSENDGGLAVVEMSQEHKPSLARERQRLEKLGVRMIRDSNSNRFLTESHAQNLGCLTPPKTSRSPSDKLPSSKQTSKSSVTSTIVAEQNEPQFEEQRNPENSNSSQILRIEMDENCDDIVNVGRVYSGSFVALRNMPRSTFPSHSPLGKKSSSSHMGGEFGSPLAVFGRNGQSITMTRSIGDRYGPRSCIAEPDYTAQTIPANQFARFILATDGLWDVISVKKVTAMALRHRNPAKVAEELVASAYRKRIHQTLHMDDITVIVVDINPHAFRSTQPSLCMGKCTLS